MRRVGVTGGIATGKSTVSRWIQERGLPLIDADEVYHQLLREDRDMLAELREEFGDGVFDAEGALDRRALGQIVFTDRSRLERLGAITHPRVRTKLVAFLEEQADLPEPPPAAFVVIPLLFENGLDVLFDTTMVVTAPEEVQLRRLQEREGIDEADAKRRIASQMPLAEKTARADLEVDNGDTLEATRTSLEAALAVLGIATP